MIAVCFMVSITGIVEAQRTNDRADEKQTTPDPPARDPSIGQGKQESIAAKADSQESDSDLFRIFLVDGDEVSGKLSISHIQCETAFGTLTVPVVKLRELVPGLDNRPEMKAEILKLTKLLGGAKQQSAEAEKKLIDMGPAVRQILRQLQDQAKAKQQDLIGKILETLNEIVEESDAGEFREWISGDTLKTSKFTVIGKVSPREFGVITKFGTLSVQLSDIKSIQPHKKKVRPNVRRSFTLDGTHLAQLKYYSSRIRLEPGDKVIVKATGTISRSRSSYYSSGPDGNSRLGTFSQNPQILGGTLVAKIGKAGKLIKIGSSFSFTAKRAGSLKFAIGMRPDYVRHTFTGSYELSVRVIRRKE